MRKVEHKMVDGDFRTKVLAIVKKIPKGQTLTYGDVAWLAGSAGAARAVGTIMSTNYDSKIPCHRVVRADGRPGEWNRGAGHKLLLLEKEGALNSKGKAKGSKYGKQRSGKRK